MDPEPNGHGLVETRRRVEHSSGSQYAYHAMSHGGTRHKEHDIAYYQSQDRKKSLVVYRHEWPLNMFAERIISLHFVREMSGPRRRILQPAKNLNSARPMSTDLLLGTVDLLLLCLFDRSMICLETLSSYTRRIALVFDIPVRHQLGWQ